MIKVFWRLSPLALTMLFVSSGYAMSNERVFVEQNMHKFGPLITLLDDQTLWGDLRRKMAVRDLTAQVICPKLSGHCALLINQCTVLSTFGEISHIMKTASFVFSDKEFRETTQKLHDGLLKLVQLLYSDLKG